MNLIPYGLYPALVRPLLFLCDPEDAHDLILFSGRLLSRGPGPALMAQRTACRPVKFGPLTLANPLGLAAGLDKNGEAIDFFGALGFGHLEVGTVTPRPQAGNQRPRLFRIKEARGVINRMGFNNKGVDYLVGNLKRRRYRGAVGVSIGKNESTPLERASEDYLYCMDRVYPFADYIAVNISCPNTPGLTELQAEDALRALIGTLKDRQDKLARHSGRYVPLVVKIAPDLPDGQLERLVNVCLELGVDALSCTNTTVTRTSVHGLTHAQERGGLSGEPLFERSTRVLRRVSELTSGRLPLIGVGGVSGVASAREKLAAGALLVQIYTALVYEGPAVIKRIIDSL